MFIQSVKSGNRRHHYLATNHTDRDGVSHECYIANLSSMKKDELDDLIKNLSRHRHERFGPRTKKKKHLALRMLNIFC